MKSLMITACLSILTINAFTQVYKINECIIDGGVLKKIEIDYNSVDGERTIMVNGVKKKFHDVYPPEGKEYAAKNKWYINNDPVSFKGKKFIKYGLPRILATDEIIRAGDIGNVGIYTEASVVVEEAEVIYIPVRAGCEFQPYQKQLDPCGTVTIKTDKLLVKEGETVTFTASFTGQKGDQEFQWYTITGKVIGEMNSPTLKVSTAGFTGKLTVDVSARTKGVNCETVYQSKTIEIKRR